MKMALFAGTTEGRHIAMVCDVYGINCTVFVATAQGCEGLECLRDRSGGPARFLRGKRRVVLRKMYIAGGMKRVLPGRSDRGSTNKK